MKNETEAIYNQIENKILNHEIYQNVKDYSKAKEKMKTYLEVGELISSVDTKYGKSIIKEYSNRLITKFGKKYSVSLLYKIKQFYSIIQKVPTMSGKLTWSHWYEMLSIDDINKIKYYVYQCEINNIDVRGLRNIIKANEYERLNEETKLKLINKEENNVADFVKNPILIKNSYNYENISEKLLQKLILEDITSFMKELGQGFSFIDNEFKIKVGDIYNYVDLLLYNIKFKCYVVIELKVTKLNSNHTGQIQNYMNYIDKNVKGLDDNKTVGIIICKQNNKFVIDYCSDDRIIAREYELV
ncbi:MAG: PDDEXK nuclease domain-containing protein [bacterium]|nr:PDDEXK nuclease domain-containing protein [bacterium]